MKKAEFMKKHGLTEMDYENLLGYEEVRKSGVISMLEYLYLMKKHGDAGDAKLADLILEDEFYSEFLETVKGV